MCLKNVKKTLINGQSCNKPDFINLFEITGRILVPNGISQLVFPEKESSDIVLCEELK